MDEALASMFDLTGQVALLTGAGRGIGLSMAQALASAGCSVALQDIDLPVAQEEAQAINTSCARNGAKAVAFGGDINDLLLPARLVDDVMQTFGRLDVLVNNASVQLEKPWIEVTGQEMEQQFRADLVSPLLFIQKVCPIFKKQKYGRIINMGSIQQKAATSQMFAYSISKGGLEKVTAGLARELARDNITINQIAPGWINTYRNRWQLTSPEVVKEMGKNIPIGRLGEPSDFRGVILFLCSKAGDYITGQSIFMDGGMGAR